MDAHDWLAEQFEVHRPHLRAVATRLLGSPTEADDALQEAWLRVGRADATGVENLGGWLTTVVARVCLNMLQSRKSRREEPAGAHLPASVARHTDSIDPEQQAVLIDSVGRALLVVMDTLTPAERLAFVLHDTFAVPFGEIAPIVERSPAATRQLASRARRRVQDAAIPDADLARQREVVTAFLAASREGDFDTLVALLAQDVVVRADQTAVDAGASKEVRGAVAVATICLVAPRAIQAALVNGAAGAVWAPGGRPRAVFAFTVTHGRIVEIDLIANIDHLRQLDLVILKGWPANHGAAGAASLARGAPPIST
jgi:RNA polymerase sigma factor (sigma-70 family)